MKTKLLPTLLSLAALIGLFLIWPKISNFVQQATGPLASEAIGPHSSTPANRTGAVQLVPNASESSGNGQVNGGANMLDVDDLLKKASLVSNRYAQAEAYSDVTTALCKAGLFDQAWETITSETGYNRTSQLDKFFLFAPLSRQQALSKISGLSDATDQKVSVTAFLAKNMHDIPDLLNDSNFKQFFLKNSSSDPSFLADVVGEALRTNFAVFALNQEAKDGVIKLFLDYQKRGLVSDSVLASMVSGNLNGTKTGIELWQWFADTPMGVNSTDPFELKVREDVVESMVAKNPDQALQNIVANKNVNAAFDLYTGLISWTALDPGKASKWYENNKSELSPEQADYAAKAFAKSAIEFSEKDGAEQWASKITSQRMREFVENEIAVKFRKDR